MAAPAPSTSFFGRRVVAAAFLLAVFGWGVGFYGPPIYLLLPGIGIHELVFGLPCYRIVNAAFERGSAQAEIAFHTCSAGTGSRRRLSLSLGDRLGPSPAGAAWRVMP